MQKFVNGSETLAIAPSIAGFYGIYTALKPSSYSVSYNVRFTKDSKTNRKDDIWKNLELELDPEYMPFQNLIQDVVLSSRSFTEAVKIFSTQKVNAPAYLILCN
jgi:hypothetical protein